MAWMPEGNTGSCLLLRLGRSKMVMPMLTGRGFPGSQVEVFLSPFYWKCQGLKLGHSACKADVLPLSHDLTPTKVTQEVCYGQEQEGL